MEQNSFTPPPPPVPVMDYDTPPRADHATRRKYLVVLVVAAVFGAMLLGLVLLRMVRTARSGAATITLTATPAPARMTVAPAGPSAADIQQRIAENRRRSNESRLQQLLALRHPPTQVVYTEDPIEARKLAGNGICNHQASRQGMSQPYWNAFEPPVYQTDGLSEVNPRDKRDALLFAHQRISPGGNQRLVLLEMEVTLEGTKLANEEYKVEITRKLKYRICKAKMSGNYPDIVRDGTSLKVEQAQGRNIIPIQWIDGTLRSARPQENDLRFFAGQADPNDPSHFTIDYELEGTKGTIDGWLTDDDFLRIVPRGGKIDKGTWHIDAP